MVRWFGLSERRSVSRLFGWMNSWLLDGELVAVFVGKLISVWVGSLVCWSVDGLPIGSLVRLFGGTLCRSAILWSVGRLVGQVFGGFICRPFVRITSGSFGWSIVWLCLAHGRSVGRPVCRLGGGWIG